MDSMVNKGTLAHRCGNCRYATHHGTYDELHRVGCLFTLGVTSEYDGIQCPAFEVKDREEEE